MVDRHLINYAADGHLCKNADGHLVNQLYASLWKLDVDGGILWTRDTRASVHATGVDGSGNIWSGSAVCENLRSTTSRMPATSSMPSTVRIFKRR